MSFNASREEGKFWRDLAAKLRVRSRGDLQKFLLLEGLKRISRGAAKELVKIRSEFSPRALGSGVLLALLCAGWLAGAHDHQRCFRCGHYRQRSQPAEIVI